MEFLTNINLKQNQLINASLHKLTTAPTGPVTGQCYFNTVDNRAYYWNGTAWVGMDSEGATMTAQNIVDAINNSVLTIDNANLSTEVNDAVSKRHEHSNKAVLDSTTASYTTEEETKIDYLTVTQAVNLDTMESNIATNNAKVTNATHTGEVTGSTALTITNKAVTNAKMADVPTQTLKGRASASTGVAEDLTVGQVRTMLNVEDGANNYTHPNHTGDVTSTGDGATVIGNKKVTLAKIADIPTATVIGRVAAGPGTAATLSKTDLLTMLNVADGAQVNTVTQVAGKTGSVTVTKADVGLGSVTDNAQVKKSASSVNGNIPTWSGTTGDALGAGYTVETTLAGSITAIPRADAVKNYVDGFLSANEAMIYKGTLGTGGTVTTVPTTYDVGWTYKIVTAGTYAGHKTEIGDMLIAIVPRTGSSNANTDWTVVQANIDGAVTGPTTATDGNIALFDGVSGKVIKNSTVKPTDFATAGHNHDSVYPKKFVSTLGGSTSQTITHNLNTRDLAVTVRRTATPWDQVITDVEFTTVNTVTVKFAVAPSASEYTITLVG